MSAVVMMGSERVGERGGRGEKGEVVMMVENGQNF